MATTLTKGTSVLDLPDNMLWPDEFGWSPVVANTRFSVTGALLVNRDTKLAGRPITLTGPWVTRATVETLDTWAADKTASMSLLFRGLTHLVCFDYGKGTPVEATPVYGVLADQAGDLYRLTLHLLKKG